MYQVGERVIYGIHGICRITGTEERTVDRKKVSYFVLEPMDQPDSKYLVPSQNPAALAKLCRIMSREELQALLASKEVRQNAWIPDENLRKQTYRELINSGDRMRLLCMVRALLTHRQEQEAAGRKFHLCDENFLRDARKLLSAEFSLVLGIPQDEVGEYLQEKLG